MNLPGEEEKQKNYKANGGEQNTESGVTDAAVAGLMLWRSMIGQCCAEALRPWRGRTTGLFVQFGGGT